MKTLQDLYKLKKNEISSDDLINLWLYDNFGVELNDIKNDIDLKNNSREFFLKYAVTQEAHDKWRKDVKQLLKKKFRLSDRRFESSFAFLYLDTAPSIKQENNNESNI